MSEFISLVDFPPHPVGGALLVLCAIIWGLRARRKVRPALLALQVAAISSLAVCLAEFASAETFTFFGLLHIIASWTVGKVFMFWVLAWLIIKLIFTIRAHNDNTKIFTRNRKS